MVDQAKLNYIVDVTFKGDITKMNNVWGCCPDWPGSRRCTAKTQATLIDRFVKEQGIKVATSENFLNYSAMRILAAAMQKAGTVTDPAKIKAAFNDVLPLPVEDNPIMYVGLQGADCWYRPPFSSSKTINIRHRFNLSGGSTMNGSSSAWWRCSLPNIKSDRRMLPLEGYVK
jgi:hypothetical protein